MTIGVIDSGVDLESNEFAGRIHPFSLDLAGNRGLDDVGGHGTAVSHVAAAARNDSGILGIAFDARLLVLRADVPGSCESDDGCRYGTNAIAAGLDRAVEAGARVVNISLGGSPPPLALRQAVDRATRAGVIVIASAGNDGDEDDPMLNFDNPDPLASGLRAAGNGLVIIAGSVDENRQISPFSNRAGVDAQSYLTALGERICCQYRDGSLFVDPNNFVFVFNGTSFAAPQIAGAVALLAQAFPNLSSAQIVALLLNTASDAGDVGTDAIYGRGILNIAAAFAPQGATSLAGSTTAITLGQASGSMSSAMGDAGGNSGANAGLTTVILDAYERAYTLNLSGAINRAAQPRLLTNQLNQLTRTMALQLGKSQLSLTISPDNEHGSVNHPLHHSPLDGQQARLASLVFASDLSATTRFGFALHTSADSLAAQVTGTAEPAFLVSRRPSSHTGFDTVISNAMALRRDFGGFSLTATAQTGAVDIVPFVSQRENERLPRFAQIGVSGDIQWHDVSLGLGLNMLNEDETVLGAKFDPALTGQGGATSLFVDAYAGYKIGDGWSLSGQWRQGFTRPASGGLLASRGLIHSTAFSLDVQRAGLLRSSDRFALRFSQPLRVSDGGLLLTLPDSYDYATRTTGFANQRLNLAPDGRELDAEMVYSLPVFRGMLSTNIYYRKDPQNIAFAPDDVGVAVRFRRGF